MKRLLLISLFLASPLSAQTVDRHEFPKRVSIAATNDLTPLILTPPNQGSIVVTNWTTKSKAYQQGWCIAATNNLIGHQRNILIIDDDTKHDAFDKQTGFPVIILTDSKATKELQDMVEGYNVAMHQAWARELKSKQQKAEQGA